MVFAYVGFDKQLKGQKMKQCENKIIKEKVRKKKIIKPLQVKEKNFIYFFFEKKRIARLKKSKIRTVRNFLGTLS